VQLSESQDTEDSDRSWVKFIDTSNSDDEGQLGLGWDEDLSAQLGLSSGGDFSLLGSLVLSFEFLGSFGDLLSSSFIRSSSLFSLLLKS